MYARQFTIPKSLGQWELPAGCPLLKAAIPAENPRSYALPSPENDDLNLACVCCICTVASATMTNAATATSAIVGTAASILLLLFFNLFFPSVIKRECLYPFW